MRVGVLALASLLVGGATPGDAGGQTALVSARIEALLESEGSGARVTVSFRLASPDPQVELTLLAIASPAEFQDVEVSTGGGWSPTGLEEVAAGRLEGHWRGGLESLDQPSGLALRYRVPSAQVRAADGSVTGLRIPVLAPAGVSGERGSGAVEISIRSEAPLDLSRPFPSGLRVRDDRRGWELVGSAPAVPGVVRFGEHDPGDTGVPTQVPGGVFWGLWLALGALLLAYGSWMRRAEGRGEGA
jgi:hypothetical protein